MKTRIVIEIETEFKVMNDDDGEDVKQFVEDEFHKSIYDMIDDFIQDDDFEEKWLDFVGDYNEGEYDYLPQEEKDFSDFGTIKITVRNEQ